MPSQILRAGIFIAVLLAIATMIAIHQFVDKAQREGPTATREVAPPAGGVPAANAIVADAKPAPEAPDRPVRDVTPQGVIRVYMPPASPGDKRMPKPAPSIRITHPGVSPAGTITSEGATVRLYGVAFPEAKKICKGPSGERWPCGRRAYIALHNKIASATLDCEPRASTDPPASDCFIGEENLAAWLLAQGLVRLSPAIDDKALTTAEASARTAKRGLWSDPDEAAASPAEGQQKRAAPADATLISRP